MDQKRGDIYKCNVCGHVIEILNPSESPIICCGQPMILMNPNSDDTASKEKHVPIIVGVTGKKVKVGSKKHPMEEKHYIMWIEASSEEGDIDKIFLKSGDKPEAKFKFKVKSARAYCNLHGLWKSV